MYSDTNSFSSFYLFDEHKELLCTKPVVSYLQYKNFRIDLLSGERKSVTVFDFLDELNELKISTHYKSPIVLQLFFELGYLCQGLEHLIDENRPLALVSEYSEVQKKSIVEYQIQGEVKFENVSFSSFEDYHKKFQRIYQNLVDGNCYQVNLTFPFYFNIETNLSPREIMYLMWKDSLKVGAYSHGTYSHALDRFFLSNSPECLFQVEKRTCNEQEEQFFVKSLPIKGTLAVEDEKMRDEKWNELVSSLKNQAELFMITDLVCNDITKLTKHPSHVLHEKYPLHVPGLIHQFSVIESKLDKSQSIADLVRALFPGGSITGAPKKRVLEIIKDLEKYDRGYYCGSTILLYQEKKSASINIRSAEINFSSKELVYGAGGGITLQSQAQEEYDEMLNKLKSFMSIFKK